METNLGTSFYSESTIHILEKNRNINIIQLQVHVKIGRDHLLKTLAGINNLWLKRNMRTHVNMTENTCMKIKPVIMIWIQICFYIGIIYPCFNSKLNKRC